MAVTGQRNRFRSLYGRLTPHIVVEVGSNNDPDGKTHRNPLLKPEPGVEKEEEVKEDRVQVAR